MTEKFTTWGNRIKRNGTLLNIEFKTKFDAKLGCKLCNQMDKETQEFVDKVNELNRWHKDHYGKTILDERLEFKSPCEKENDKLKKENKKLKSKFEFEEMDVGYVLGLLKRTIDELKYFIKDYEEDEIDITVHSLIRDVDLLLGNKQVIFSEYISFIIDCKEDLEKENKELKQRIERLENYKEASIKFTKEVEAFFERHEIDTVNFDILDIVFENFEFYSDKYNELKKENKELKELIKKTLETTPIEHNLAVELKNSVREFYD